MATYNPNRKTEDGTEEVKFPMSSIDGLNEAFKKIPTLNTPLHKNNTLAELVVFLRENGISRYDRCLLHCTETNGGLWFADTIVQIDDPFTETSIININEFYLPSNPINYSDTLNTSTTIGEIINTRDNLLNTDEKTIVGAINEVNGKTIDKIGSIDTYVVGASELDVSNGISWVDIFEFYEQVGMNGASLTGGDIFHRVPIVAGDNVTFTVDSKNQVVKINATGGSSSTDDSMIGTWVFNNEISAMNADFVIRFECGGVEYTQITNDYGELLRYGNNEVDIEVYWEGWNDATYKTIKLLEEPTDDAFISWLKENATKQSVSSSGGGDVFPLPRIRFANFLNDLDNTGMYRFTVENLGGGTLQVGDKLQICCKRKFQGGKIKLRKMAEYVITEDDINQRFLKIEVDPNNDAVQKWLFRNNRSGTNHSTLSAMYFRLKRITAYDGEGGECNAIFSNVETVWKTYDLVGGAPHALLIK